MAGENMGFSDLDIQWHPAFCAAAELELAANREELDFKREYNLSKKPLQVDLLVVEKRDDVKIENEIGRIFRRNNVIEYKSPGDGVTIDDFFKTVGYAYIYKGLGETVDQIPVDQLTVSLFREGYPRELFRSLEKYGLAVEKRFDGIYYIKGLLIPAQVVVTGELASERHRSLKILSRNASEDDIRGFVEEAQNLTGQGERANVDAILQASVSANYEMYNVIRRDSDMCEAMRILMKDEIARDVREAERKGQLEGLALGEMKKARETVYELYDRNMPPETISAIVKVSVEQVKDWIDERLVTV